MTDQTVTIYNRYGNDNPAMWGRTVLTGVHWMSGFGVAPSGQSGVNGGQLACLLIIPMDNRYCNPEAYRAAKDRDQFWTIQEGDVLVPGEGPKAESGNIRKTLTGCKVVTGMVAHIYGSALDHWEVTAK